MQPKGPRRSSLSSATPLSVTSVCTPINQATERRRDGLPLSPNNSRWHLCSQMLLIHQDRPRDRVPCGTSRRCPAQRTVPGFPFQQGSGSVQRSPSRALGSGLCARRRNEPWRSTPGGSRPACAARRHRSQPPAAPLPGGGARPGTIPAPRLPTSQPGYRQPSGRASPDAPSQGRGAAGSRRVRIPRSRGARTRPRGSAAPRERRPLRPTADGSRPAR